MTKTRKFSAILAIILIFVTLFTFSGCDVILDAIGLGTTLTIEAEYLGGDIYQGYNLNPDDVKVTVSFTNGLTGEVNSYMSTKFTLSGFDSATLGEKQVTVTYTEGNKTATDTFAVTVVEKVVPTGITATYNGGTLTVGDVFDKSQVSAVMSYSNGTTQPITGFYVSDVDTSTAGDKLVAVSYIYYEHPNHEGGPMFETTVKVTVVSPPVVFQNITAVYTGDPIEQNGTLDETKFLVQEVYSDGSRVSTTNYTVSSLDTSTAGAKEVTVTVTKEGQTYTTTATVTVVEAEVALESISATFDNTSFYVGESLTKGDFTVTATYVGGHTSQVVDFAINGETTFATAGNYPVELSFTYKDITKTCTVTVTVLAEKVKLQSISATVINDELTTDDTLSNADFAVTATMTDGTTQKVSDFVITSQKTFTQAGEYLVEISYTFDGITKTCTVTVTIITTGIHDLSIHLMDLGKSSGDSIYIKAGETDILIDAGATTGSLAQTVPYLKERVEGKIEYLIVTHGDSDHIAGFSNSSTYKNMFQEFDFDTIIDFPKTTKSTEMYKEYVANRDAEVANGAKHYTALECVNQSNGAKKVYDLTGDGGITMEILYQKYYETSTSNENNYSVCMMLTQKTNEGNQYYLFTGDLEKSGEESLVASNNLPENILFYKAGHHGSDTASNAVLMDKIKPQYVGISGSAGDAKHDFPHQGALNNIAKWTDNVYMNMCNSTTYQMCGNLVFEYKDGKFTVTGSNHSQKLKDTAWFANNPLNLTWPTGA